MRLIYFIVYVMIGAMIFLAGCRLSLTAEKLEASAEIYRADYHIGQNPEPIRD